MVNENKEQIYVVFSCDNWKTPNSMRLEMATTSPQKLRDFIIQKLEDGDFAYEDEFESAEWQVEKFKCDFDNKEVVLVDSRLKYCYIESVTDGEEV